MGASLGTIAGAAIGTTLVEDANLGTTAQVADGTSGSIHQVYIDNSNNSNQVYLKCYDTTGSVTVGGTQPDFVFPCAASSIRQFNFTDGIAYANGLKIACSADAGRGDDDGTPTTPGSGAVVVRLNIAT
jgi:hypothetical protein